jgi:NTE family protein
MDSNLLNLLEASKLFSSLDDAGRKKLIPLLHEIKLKKNRYLFRQGELSDGVYLVMSGKLIAILKTVSDENKVLSEIRVGETLGEIGAMSHEPRGASAKALEDSILFKLSCEDFFKLCSEYPSLLLQTMEVLATRSRNLIQMLTAREPAKKHIAVIPASKHTRIKEFFDCLLKHLPSFPNVTILSDYDDGLADKTLSQLQNHIKELDAKNEKIIYILGLHDTHLSKACFENVDALYVMGNGRTKAYLNPVTHKRLHNAELSYKASPELILVYPNGDKPPKATSKWLKLINFGMHHHVRLCEQKDIQRIMRFLTSNAVGLVLGGGGARSWAHIGAIKGLQDAGIPIDLICGTSGGAIVGGYYALNESVDDKNNQLSDLSKITYRAASLRHITWPAVSIFNGTNFTNKQKEIFGNTKIEDLWLPFFCVSCNLTKSVPIVHDRGELWKKIRASTSVPGIFPPVVLHGQLHLDGGIVNNLPVDLMKKFSSSINMSIAVELIHVTQEAKDYYFPPILPLIPTFLAKFKLAYKNYKFPSFVDTFLKSLLAGSSVKQNENALAADVLISPKLSNFDLLRVTPKQQKQLIEIGRKATYEVLNNPRKRKQIRLDHKVSLHHSRTKVKLETKSKVKDNSDTT